MTDNHEMANTSDISLMRHKLTRRFYEPLLLLDALGPIRGERIRSEMIPDDSESNHTKLRRSFADTIAYICAYQKGPDHVTAAALEKTPQGVAVWLSANADVEEKVVTFLEGILACVHRVAEQDNLEDSCQEALLAQQRLSSMIVDFQAPRLNVYYKEIIKSCINPCQQILTDHVARNGSIERDRSALQINSLQQWLGEYFGGDGGRSAGPSLLNLVNACYGMRHTQYLKTIGMFAGQGRTRHETFGRLYRLLGKLGKPIKSSKTLTEAATKLTQDFAQGFTVKTVPSSMLLPLPFRRKSEGTLQRIIDRMFSDSSQRTEFVNRLSSLEGGDVSMFLQRERSAKTKVHAELLLIYAFERSGCDFLDGGEKYIGCSKPACYLCHMYITQHPTRYIVPSSHNKVYVGWRPPDVSIRDLDTTASLAVQERILMQMIDLVRRDLFAEMRSRNMRPPYHTDSTTGITSTLRSTQLGENDTNHVVHPGDLEHSTTNLLESDEENEEDQGGARI